MMNGNNDDDNADDNDDDNDVDSADDNSVIIGKLNNICTRIRSFLGNRIIVVFVFGHQNTIRSPLIPHS